MKWKIIIVVSLVIIFLGMGIYFIMQRPSLGQSQINPNNEKDLRRQAILNTPSFITEISPTNIVYSCSYVVSKQDGNESFLDVSFAKMDRKAECSDIQINMTFNKTKAEEYGQSIINEAVERGDLNNLSVLAESLVWLNYEPPADYQVRYGASEDTAIYENITREFRKAGGNFLPTYQAGDTISYSIVANPFTTPYIKFGYNSIELTINSTTSGVDYGTNVTIEPGNFSHLNISTSAPYDSLVAYWSFDGDTDNTTTYDFTENNLDGTYKNGSFINDSCIFGSCVAFRDEDSIEVPDNNLFDLAGENLTMCAWYNLYSNGTNLYHALFGKQRNPGTYMYGFTTESGGVVPFQWRATINGGSSKNTGVTIPEINKWYHACFTIVSNDTGTNITGYQDGVAKPSVHSITFIDNALPFQIGKVGTNNGGYLNGSVDEVMFFNISLTPEQISDIYNNQSARFATTGKQSNNGTINSTYTGFQNRVNVSAVGFKNNMSSNLSLQIGYLNDTGWQLTPMQNITQYNTNYTFNLTGGATNATINWTFIAGNTSTQFWTPILRGNITLSFWNFTEGAAPADPCEYTSGNFEMPCGCNVTSNIDLGGNNITINGTGITLLTANVSNYNTKFIFGGCEVGRKNGGGFKK